MEIEWYIFEGSILNARKLIDFQGKKEEEIFEALNMQGWNWLLFSLINEISDEVWNDVWLMLLYG